MTVRDTSLEAYSQIGPTLGEKQAQVLGVLQREGPLSNSEIAAALNWSINRVTPRTGELCAAGLVLEMKRRTCRVTGRNVLTWGVPTNTLF